MPKEIRRLVFTHPETTVAIVEYAKPYKMVFPIGKIIRASFAGTAEYEFHTMKKFDTNLHEEYNVERKKQSIIITFFDETTFEHKFYNLTADFVSAALIDYCVHKKIMLPRNARKTLDITEFNVCLDINFDYHTEPEDDLKLETQ